MVKEKKISVIIPCFNEKHYGKGSELLVKRLTKVLKTLSWLNLLML